MTASAQLAVIQIVTQTKVWREEDLEIGAPLPDDMTAIGGDRSSVVAAYRLMGLCHLNSSHLCRPSNKPHAISGRFLSLTQSTALRPLKGLGVVGFAYGGPARQPAIFDGAELYAIYVRPKFEQQGIGRALFKAVAAELIELSPNGFLPHGSFCKSKPSVLSFDGRS